MERGTLYAGGLLIVLVAATAVIIQGTTPTTPTPDTETDLETFSSQDDFRSYLRSASQESSGTAYMGSTAEFQRTTTAADSLDTNLEAGGDGTGAGTGGSAKADRYSETNVQEVGIDEPDIAKTDGNTIFYSRGNHWNGNTSLIDAMPVDNMSVSANIDTQGRMLLHDDVLTVLGQDEIVAYDVSDPDSPSEEWSMDYNGSIQAARLYNSTVYLVLRNDIDYDTPCPIRPMARAGGAITVPCSSIYHPRDPVRSDVTYTAVQVDPSDGSVGDRASFLGSYSQSVVYMSRNGLYVTNTERTSRDEAFLQFFRTEGDDLVDDRTYDRIQRLDGYNISDRAKMVEIETILRDYRRSLGGDDRREFETRLTNAFTNWTEDRAREFQTTHITRVSISDGLSVTGTGSIPGAPLNQFSMDEHEGNLRIATTVEPIGWRGESENDVYVLDEQLDVTGSVTGMGINERIYAVRFIGDEGYVVTFRRIDPFHVLDLSDPSSPELTGELKLPGFSSYLHPLGEDRILGVGEEDNQVKLVIFDVSDPSSPVVEDDYILDEYWSDVSSTHHAFLMDEKHGVFFIPASRGGYVFSYEDGLELEKAVDMQQAERALYIDDYMYILGMDEIVVLDETSWDRAGKLTLPELRDRHPVYYREGDAGRPEPTVVR